jgi:hypothetical protein
MALAAGDYEGASEWFQLSVLMRPLNSPLSSFSYVQLGRWYTGNRTLRLQAAFAGEPPKARPRAKRAI